VINIDRGFVIRVDEFEIRARGAGGSARDCRA